MAHWRGWFVVVVVMGCGKKKQDAPPATGSATPVIVADAAAPAIDAAIAATCMPDPPSTFGRIGTELVGCSNGDTECWTIDPKTGSATPRAPVHVPGFGFLVDRAKLKQPTCYEGLCWKAPTREPDFEEPTQIWVAYHPDGKRAVVVDDPEGTIFDLATKQPVATFVTDIGNSLSGVWFSGNFVADAGYDAGPYALLVYHDAKTGKKAGTFEDLFGGGVGIASTGAYLVADDGMGSVTVVDGSSVKGKVTKRKIPKPPAGCSPHDPGLDPESDDPATKDCLAFAKKYYGGYYDVTLTDDPTGAGAYIGQTDDALFVLDKNLVELSRVKLAVCPPKPE